VSFSTELACPRHVRFLLDSDQTADVPDRQLRAKCGNSSFFDHLGSQRNHARLDYVGLRFYSDVGFCCRWMHSSVDLNKENSVLMEYLRYSCISNSVSALFRPFRRQLSKCHWTKAEQNSHQLLARRKMKWLA
jgi:hypothetical protein